MCNFENLLYKRVRKGYDKLVKEVILLHEKCYPNNVKGKESLELALPLSTITDSALLQKSLINLKNIVGLLFSDNREIYKEFIDILVEFELDCLGSEEGDGQQIMLRHKKDCLANRTTGQIRSIVVDECLDIKVIDALFDILCELYDFYELLDVRAVKVRVVEYLKDNGLDGDITNKISEILDEHISDYLTLIE